MELPNVEKLRQSARELGFEGEEAKRWVIEAYKREEDEERDRKKREEDEERGRKRREEDEERGRKRREEDEEREKRKFKREEESKRLEHIRIMELKAREEETPRVEEKSTGNSGNKLPMFDGIGDNLEFFLVRFEDEARHKEWPVKHWGYELRKLMPQPLLPVCYAGSGKGVEASYEEVKTALSRHFGLTAQGYRERLAGVRPRKGEDILAYSNRIRHYLTKWIELSKTEKTYEKLFELTVVDKLLQTVSGGVVEHILERGSLDLTSVIKTGEGYMAAHPSVKLTRDSAPLIGNQRVQGRREESRREDNYQWRGTGYQTKR